jgi:co-chaperonin GroES (HSP10)
MVLRDETPEKTEGGIYIPEEGKRRESTGRILQLGQSFEAEAEKLGVAGLREGDWVSFNAFDGVDHKVRAGGKDWVVVVLHAGQVYLRDKGKEEG